MHTARYPGRTIQSVRRKYTLTHRKKAPSGDPDQPEEIRLAKEIKNLIGDKALIGGGEEVYNMEGNGSFLNADGTLSDVPAAANMEMRANNSNVISLAHSTQARTGAGGRPDFASML